MQPSQEIPSELRDLVSKSVKLLGVGIQHVYGKKLYQQIEDLRLKMKSVRAHDADVVHAAMEEVYARLRKSPTQDLFLISKAFSLMLELINSCEASYRSYRLGNYKITSETAPTSLVYVFTSHPTEARSREFLNLMGKIEKLLSLALKEGFQTIEDRLLHLLQMALRVHLANHRRPQVIDEAEGIFHFVLDECILSEQVELIKNGIQVYFRTWVGGDKDGHPKVGPATMLQSLNLSRAKILHYIENRACDFESEVKNIVMPEKFKRHFSQFKASIRSLRKIKAGDGKRVIEFKARYQQLKTTAREHHLLSPGLADLEHLIWIYPALVLPLEIREDHELIHEALKKPSMNIAKMLLQLKKISKGLDAKWYVRGFIISMCQTTDDLLAAVKLTKKICGGYVLPVVPLFENEKGLLNGVSILKEAFRQFPLLAEHQKRWNGKYEVMLGYSDSSKENGVFSGRLLVEKAIFNLEEFLQGEGLTPVFFHGSGGSVSRGGGSVREQIAWLPESALSIYKVTIQGETVQRNFHEAKIMRSQVGKIVDEYNQYRPRKQVRSDEVIEFSQEIQRLYRELVQDPEFQEVAMQATPYDFLNLLKIGSRPTKRSGKGKFTLRAIPWILCWTQTRLLMPIWWGLGTAWENQSEKNKAKIKEQFQESPLLQSYMKNLGFTLAKMELGVWKFQLSHSNLSAEKKKLWFEKMQTEVEKTKVFFRDLTGGDDFTWFNHRLGESIVFRSSMIHPLNVIQKISLERNENNLLRETVTGIACGMLTTG